MRFYIVDDEPLIVRILENIIEENDLGDVIGTAVDSVVALEEISFHKPDIVLLDMLMPVKDGTSLVEELKKTHKDIKFIMISQVTTKSMIGKAYDAGIEFFINKPINKIEVTTVINRIREKVELENNFKVIENIVSSRGGGATEKVADTKKNQITEIKKIFSRLGIMGEKGSEDILEICKYMKMKNISSFDFKVKDICTELSDNPKAMEQRIRRAINKGLSNLANLGIEDYMNDVFVRYSNSLYDFENVKAEMDYVRGKRTAGGKISLRRFIDNLLLMCEE